MACDAKTLDSTPSRLMYIYIHTYIQSNNRYSTKEASDVEFGQSHPSAFQSKRRLGLLCGHAGGDLFLVKKSPHSTAFVGLDRARRLKPVGRPKSAKSPQPTAVLFRSFGDPDSEHSSGRTKLSVRAKPMSVFAESSPTKRCVEMGVRHGVWQKVRL